MFSQEKSESSDTLFKGEQKGLTTIDKLLLGDKNPDFIKHQKYKSALDDLKDGKLDSELVQNVLAQPIPHHLQNISHTVIAKVCELSFFPGRQSLDLASLSFSSRPG